MKGSSKYGWPEFCKARQVLVLVLLAAGLALLLAVIQTRSPDQFWVVFGFHLLPTVWLVLIATAALCVLGRVGGLPRLAALLISLALVQVLVLVGSWGYARSLFITPPVESIALTQPDWFVWRNLVVSLLVSFVSARYLVLSQRWQEAVVAESRATLRSLQARIHPHFLFNALNTISSLIHDRPDQAEQATLDLSDLLRTGLTERTRHSLDDELELVRGYLRLEALRLGERLDVAWRLADDLPLDEEIPVLLIQPLVENAVVHGIARLPAGGRLSIVGERMRRGRLRFLIENPLPDRAESGQASDGNRMALDNVRQRLDLAWEEGARLRTRQEDGRFSAELVLPVSAD